MRKKPLLSGILACFGYLDYTKYRQICKAEKYGFFALQVDKPLPRGVK